MAVGYYGSKGTHLPGIVDFNLVAPGDAVAAGIIPPGTQVTSTGVTARLNAVRPYKGFVAINSIQNWFNSNYNSLQVSGDKRFQDGSLVRLSYTWSHSLTDNQTDRSSAPQSFYNRAADYGPDGLDSTARVLDAAQLRHVGAGDDLEAAGGTLLIGDHPRRIAVIAVTAFAMKGDEEKIREGGCEAYISKPISVVNFLETVEKFLA